VKRRITGDQLNELTEVQKQKLREQWKPEAGDVIESDIFDSEILIGAVDRESLYACTDTDFSVIYEKLLCLPLLSIGQMIEIIGNDWYMKAFCTSMHDCGIYKNMKYWKNDDLCDALWEAVKERLEGLK